MTIVDMNGNPVEVVEEEKEGDRIGQDPSKWQPAFPDGEMFPLKGHWFRVVERFNDALVLAYVKPTSKERKKGG